jgi:tetratricopeptide (TPR) repeat protein
MKTRSLCIIAISLFYLFSCSSEPKVDETAIDFFRSAKSNFRSENYHQALDAINEAISLDSTKNTYFGLRIKILTELSDTLHFEQDLDHILQYSENDDEKDFHLRKLIKWESHKNKDNAYVLIQNELSIHEEDSEKHLDAIQFVIEQYINLEDTIAALKLCKESLKKYPEEPMLFNQLAQIELRQKDYRSAIKHYRSYVDLDKTNDIVLSNLAFCYLERKSKSQAIKYYKMAADLGNIEACKQHRELTARIRYNTQSRCCDGSLSYSTGRGTCSHHGGVCTIEHTPYKEYTVPSCN